MEIVQILLVPILILWLWFNVNTHVLYRQKTKFLCFQKQCIDLICVCANRKKEGIDCGDIFMSYRSIFQDVRAAMDWVHLNVSLHLLSLEGGRFKRKFPKLCYVCYLYFDFHTAVSWGFWTEGEWKFVVKIRLMLPGLGVIKSEHIQTWDKPSRLLWSPHLNLSLNRRSHLGTTDDFTTSFIHFPLFSLPFRTWQTPGLSIPWCCLPTSFSVCLVFFPFSLCLARWFWQDLMIGRPVSTTSVCVSLRWSWGFVWSDCLLDLGTDLLVSNLVFVWNA